mgnify:CR=1 FL=1
MEYIIRKCTADDADGRGMVHYQAWKETYSECMPTEYLNKLRLDDLIETARKHTDNTFVAVVGEKVVGFSCYLQNSREFVSVKPSSEIVALYVLKEYQGFGIGKALMAAVKDELTEKNILLFVLKGNEQASKFYEHIGFSFTGKSISQEVSGGTIEELEMILTR